MGRRKIEIKAIKDDRNRSVTFLKRKGGLFKKAHELSVLCSVDVAVIIFGHNKKLYEFSSGDINETIGRYQYYGGPHEHKGPADFAGKRDMDGSDDEDVDEAAIENEMEQAVPPHMQNQQHFARMRQGPSASPPIGNGVMPYHRQRTPQPPGMGSRPSSRNQNPIPRPNSTLNQVSHPPPMANGYAYMANQGVFNPHAPPGMPGGPHPPPQHPQQPQPQFQQFNRMHQMPQQFMQQQQQQQQDQRRGSMPQYAQNDRLQPQAPLKTERHSASPPQQPQELEQGRNDMLQPQQPKPLGTKSRSIFTPIDDRGSLLAQHWGLGSSTNEPQQQDVSKTDASADKDRSQSVDIAAVNRVNGPTKPPQPQRVFSQPQRTQSITSLSGDGKRPRLKVQIPSEQSDDGGSAGDESSPHHGQPNNSTGSRPAITSSSPPLKTDHPNSHASSTNSTSGSGGGPGSGVVLPPPSPSASAILSAGAQGPPNPFARPLPPGAGGPNGANGPNATTNQNSSAYASNSNIETPISALPSRFLPDGMLPSPSSFYPDWGFGRSADSNVLPSPLNFTTPVAGTGPSFGGSANGAGKEGEGNGGGLKRKSPEQDVSNGVGVGPGGPMGREGDGMGGKRIKAES